MKRSNKVLLLTGLATVTIGAAGILHINYIQKPEENVNTIKAYNHQPANILDNLFERNNVKYLPFIFESSDQTITKDKVVSEFARKGLTVKNISTNNKIVTGTQITVQENANTYTVIIYGDVDGDGEITVFDAQACVDDFVNDGRNLTGAYKIAANVENGDNEVDVFDAQRVVDFYVGIQEKLVVNEPTSLVENDTTPPVIRIDGQTITETQTIKIKVGDNYNEPNVTANDDVDGDLTASIVKSGDTVNVNAEGTYTIRYTVSDSKGNTTTVTRVVVVEKSQGGGPVIKEDGIIMGTYPQNTRYSYPYNEALTVEKIDLTGATLQVTKNGSTTNQSITIEMLSTNDDLTTAGSKSIKVDYPNKENAEMSTYFSITILKPITQLMIDNTDMTTQSVQKVENGYIVALNTEDFVTIGEIKASGDSDTSPLEFEQLKEMKKECVPTVDSTATVENLEIKYEKVENKILIKVKVNKAGEYTIKPYIQYEGGEEIGESFKITAKTINPILSNIRLGEEGQTISKLDLHILEPSDKTNIDEEEIDGKKVYYTKIPVTFFDQNGIKMELQQSDIQENITTTENGKLSIQLPKVKILGQDASDASAILVKYYKNDDNKIEQIGFALANTSVNLDTLSNVIFKVGTQETKELPVEIQYKIPETLNLEIKDKETQKPIGTIGTIYTVRKDAEFVFEIKTRNGERPLRLDEVTNVTGTGTGITIYQNQAKYNQEGNIEIRGKITNDVAQVYTLIVNAEVAGSPINSDSIKIQAFNVPANLKPALTEIENDTEINNENPISLIIGEDGVLKKLILKVEGIRNDNIEVQNQYVTFSQTTINGKEYLVPEVIKLTPEGDITDIEADDSAEYIGLELSENAITSATVELTITFYKGLPGLETSETFKVNISTQK